MATYFFKSKQFAFITKYKDFENSAAKYFLISQRFLNIWYIKIDENGHAEKALFDLK